MGALVSRLTGRRYRLVAALAKGGMGEVFIAVETGPKAAPDAQPVAVKTLILDNVSDRGMFDRFLDEARISARLQHPNIARLLDFGEAEGRPFMVFELLDGADLGACLDALDARGGIPEVPVALAAIAEAARGLHHAHRLEKDGVPLGIVHRDLSPSNLFVTRDGQVKVLDFGAAWGRERYTKTATGNIIGKIQYMPPEQIKGERVDARADVFALGLCLHESLTLARALDDTDERERIKKVYYAQVPPVEGLRPGLPEGVVAIVRRATAAEAGDRFASAGELADALERELRRETTKSARQLMAGFYASCFTPDQLREKQQRLAALLAASDPDPAGPFAWTAPSMSGPVAQPANEPPTPIIAAPEPDTDEQPEPIVTDVEPSGPTAIRPIPAPAPAAPPAVAQPPRMLGYAIVAVVIVAAIALGLLLGRAGAGLSR